MKYICPEKDCADWGNEENCNHGVPHEETGTCFLGNSICQDCVEEKDE